MNAANKKVLMVTTLFPSEEKPYYCVFLLQLFEALREQGYTVDILMPNAALADGAVTETEYRGFNILHVGYTGGRIKGLLGMVSPGFSGRVRQILNNQKPDLVNIHFSSAEICKAVIRAARKSEVPSVMHYHGLNVYRDYYVAHPWLERFLGRHKRWIPKHVDAVVGVSRKVGEIVRRKVDKAAIYTVYNGVDTALFYPAEEKHNEVFTIVCVANLIAIKGHEYLLRAAREVIVIHDRPLRLRLIGIGPEKDRLQALAEELGIAKSVEFLGAQNYDVVAQEIRQADFYIMPSYFESLGCVYLEAMASGVAALGIKGCGIDEVITDKQTGYLAEPHNTEQITERILYAIENPEDHDRIARAGYDRVTGQYQWSHAGQALARVYEEILQGSKEHA